MTQPIVITTKFNLPASPDEITRTAEALTARGITVHRVESPAQALAKIHELIPAGETIMTGASLTLKEIGLEDELKNHQQPWVYLKEAILAETDRAAQKQLRVQSTLAPWYLGSVQAVAQTGELVIASGTGSQIPAYAYSSPNVVWVVGSQKIVPTLADALARIREYALPLEHSRFQAMGMGSATLGKILIIEQEPPYTHRSLHLILVDEPVGA